MTAAPKLNARQQAFCRHIAAGSSARAAYQRAGYAVSDNVADANGARLLANAKVRERVAELQDNAAHRAEVTIDTIAAQLDEDRRLAYACKSPSAAVAATMGKAKLFGFLAEQPAVEVNFNYSTMTEEELIAEIANIHQQVWAIKRGQLIDH